MLGFSWPWIWEEEIDVTLKEGSLLKWDDTGFSRKDCSAGYVLIMSNDWTDSKMT